MLRTLRNRLILSHVLPVLVIIPIMGIALIFILETRFLLPSLSNQLAGDARLIAEITGGEPRAWQDPAYAQQLLDQVNPNLSARVMLLRADGRLLASTDPADRALVGQRLDAPGIEDAMAGQMTRRINYAPRLGSEVIDVVAPVSGKGDAVVGMVRMTYRLEGIYAQFASLRSFIAGILLVGLVSGSVLGFILALNIGSPIRRVTEAVYELAGGSHSGRLVEQGPEEVRGLLRSVNYLASRLHSLEDARRRLLANLVHELGRPLGALRSAIQALRSGAAEDPQLRQDLLAGMDEEAAGLQRLLEDLAQLHGQILGTLELDLQPVAMSEYLNRVLLAWGEAAQEKHVQWQAQIPADLPEIQADPVRLGQAIGNLASNAIKFTPAGGAVSVTAGRADGQVWVRVSDTGPGVSHEEQAKIFDAFFRARQERRFPQGMGLGLSIAQSLMQAHGGKIEVESEPGKGSRFTLWLPEHPPGGQQSL